MSRARTLAGAIGSDGALNVADVAGLAAVASSGSASDLSTGTLPVARLATTSDFTINGLTVGKGAGAVSTNTAVGASALQANTSGNAQTVYGYNAMYTNTSGAENTAIGYNSLYYNTTGNNNVAVGRSALQSNTTASNNTAVGYQAGYSNTTGNNITAVGYQAGYSNSIGTNNTFMGRLTGYATTTANYNTAMGSPALYQNTTGASNTAIGDAALYWNTTGSNNTALGASSLQYNTTASNNTAVGYQAGYSGTTASDSTYVGNFAGYGATTGTRNTLVGFYTGSAITTGTFNNFFGTQAGQAVTTGGKNTILGSYSGNQGGLDIRTSSNNVVLSDGDGNAYYRTAGSLLHLGADLTTGLNGYGGENVTKINYYMGSGGFFAINSAAPNGNACMYVSLSSSATTSVLINFAKSGSGVGYISTNGSSTAYNTSSDYRLKENIAPMTGALAKVAALKPCTYTWKSDGSAGEGFIAHELANVIPDAVTGEKDATRIEQYEISPAVPATFDDEGNELTPAVEAVIGEREVPVYQGIDTSFLVATLTAAIQELKAEFDAYKEAHP